MSDRLPTRCHSGRRPRSPTALRRGDRASGARRVLAYPTETVYGFGGAIDRDSVERAGPTQGSTARESPSCCSSPVASMIDAPRSAAAELRGEARGATLARPAHARSFRAARSAYPRASARSRGWHRGAVDVARGPHASDRRPMAIRSRRPARTGPGIRRRWPRTKFESSGATRWAVAYSACSTAAASSRRHRRPSSTARAPGRA